MRDGLFISFEGIDGCGKSTQVARLAKCLKGQGHEVVCTREPGGTRISEKIRMILLNPANTELAPITELLLLEASRAQLVQEVILPALERGAIVLSDRYADSTSAYQEAGRALQHAEVAQANKLGTCGVEPDITFLMDMNPHEALARAMEHGADRIEAAGIAFQERVRQGYLTLVEEYPNRIQVIDASMSLEEVSISIDQVLAKELDRLEVHHD